MNINDFFDCLELSEDGIYISCKTKISYPEEGNEQFFDIEEKSFWFKYRNNIEV